MKLYSQIPPQIEAVENVRIILLNYVRKNNIIVFIFHKNLLFIFSTFNINFHKYGEKIIFCVVYLYFQIFKEIL